MKNKPDYKARLKYRADNMRRFANCIDNLVVLSRPLKERIESAYARQHSRLDSAGITVENWGATNKDAEYHGLIAEIELLGIFSKQFKTVLRTHFLLLCESYNPHADFNF